MPTAVIINTNLVIHACKIHSTIIINIDYVHCIEYKKRTRKQTNTNE